MAIKLDEVRWGMIGCGAVTEKKSAPAFNQIAHSRLVAVMGRDSSKVADYAARHQIPRWYTDAAPLIEDPDVNAVYIATPPLSHAGFAIQALRAGKAVYVEKPMACRYAECQAMNQAARAAGLPLFVAYYRRSLPYFLKIKELIDAAAIGGIQAVNIRLQQTPRPADRDPARLPWRVKPEIAGGGYFVDLACHTLDVLDFMLGPIASASGHCTNRGGLYAAEDTVAASFRFENGVIGTGFWCFATDEASRGDSVEILGSRGAIRFSTFGFTPIELTNQQGTQHYLPANPEHIQFHLIEAIVAELRGQGRSPSNGASAARTSWVMDKILGNSAPVDTR